MVFVNAVALARTVAGTGAEDPPEAIAAAARRAICVSLKADSTVGTPLVLTVPVTTESKYAILAAETAVSVAKMVW